MDWTQWASYEGSKEKRYCREEDGASGQLVFLGRKLCHQLCLGGLRMASWVSSGNPLSGNRTSPKATLILDYPDTPKVRLALGDKRPSIVSTKPTAGDGLRITAIQFDKMHLSLIAVAGR